MSQSLVDPSLVGEVKEASRVRGVNEIREDTPGLAFRDEAIDGLNRPRTYPIHFDVGKVLVEGFHHEVDVLRGGHRDVDSEFPFSLIDRGFLCRSGRYAGGEKRRERRQRFNPAANAMRLRKCHRQLSLSARNDRMATHGAARGNMIVICRYTSIYQRPCA